MFGNKDFIGMVKGEIAEGNVNLTRYPGCRVKNLVTVIRIDGELSQIIFAGTLYRFYFFGIMILAGGFR